jgi:hypothetical protein
VNIVLKGCRCISETEEYNRVFVVPIIGTEGYFPLIALLNTNLVVGVLDIDLTKDL